MATEHNPFGQPTPSARPEPTTPWGAALSGQIPVAPPQREPPPDPTVPIALDGDDGDIIAPVAAPSVDEVFPAATWPHTPTYLDTHSPEVAPPAPVPPDSYQALGNMAATNASMSAAGAPTPLGGVPRPSLFAHVAATTPIPELAPAPPTVPFPEPAGTVPFLEPIMADPFGSFAGFDQATEALPTYEPTSTPAQSPTAEWTVPHQFTEDHVPWWRGAAALVLAGLIMMAGLGTGAYMAWGVSEPLELPAPVILATPHSTAPQPMELGEVSDFVASMPLRTLTHALVDVQEVRFRDVPLLQVRTVEVVDLSYFDGINTVSMRAMQHYTVEEAQAAFVGYVQEADGVAPLIHAGVELGEIVTITTEETTTIVWRNTTAIFMVSGEGDLDEFVRLFAY